MENKQFESIQTLCWQGKVFKKGNVYEAEYTGDGYYTLHAENGEFLLGSHVIDRVMAYWKNHFVEVQRSS
ncbi:hypothetical protein [Listeria booriae]|uniref:hypothetical protein n=1 Tax=Listeria booriae TaxID=1552123 RepID=UPI001E56FF22|nr:hypothetical protein [Listeria booriae]MCD2208607.1 hypothetical protein [Listeria booriae]